MLIRSTILGLAALAGVGFPAHVYWSGPSADLAVDLPAGPKNFAIDAGHSAVLFRVSHLGFSNTYGRFNELGGSFVIDEEDPKASSIELTVQAKSIDTNSEGRDKHLRNPDFLNAKQYPTITFKSTKVEAGTGETLKVTGDLSMMGKTKSITVDVEKFRTGKGPRGATRTGFETMFTVNRHDFGMDYAKGGIGADVTIVVAIEGVLK